MMFTASSKAPLKAPAPPPKRDFFRVPLRLRIDVDAGMSVPLPAMLVDISGGGCLIASRIMVEAGQTVSYTLRRGDGKPDLHLGGVIRTKRYAEAEHIYFYGVKFDEMKAAEHDVLLQEISYLERRLIVHKRGEADSPAKKAPAVALTASSKKKAQQARSAFRVSWPFQMTYTVPGLPGIHRATALDTSAGGMRIATDMVLRREWVLELTFTMPAQVLEVLEQHESVNTSELFGNRYALKSKVIKQRPFAPITVRAHVVPGIQESRGRYVHGISFKDADHLVREEITRFVHAAQLSKRRLNV
ncbi:MAG: hypothetical protein NVSMB31_09130 [Vulcanimicrobiaceae bacterium]